MAIILLGNYFKENSSNIHTNFTEYIYIFPNLVMALCCQFSILCCFFAAYKTKTPSFDGAFAVTAYLIFASALLSGTAIRLAMTHFAKSMRIKTDVRVMTALSRSDWV